MQFSTQCIRSRLKRNKNKRLSAKKIVDSKGAAPLKSTSRNYYRIVTPLYINGQAIYSSQVWAYPPLKAYAWLRSCLKFFLRTFETASYNIEPSANAWR